MKREYVVPNLEVFDMKPKDDLMWNGAGLEEGILTASWEGGIPTDKEDEDDSDTAKEGTFVWGNLWANIFDEEDEEEY